MPEFPSEKGSTLKGKNLIPRRTNSFLLEKTLIPLFNPSPLDPEVVGWCEGVMYLMSPGRPTDIGLQLGKACYPCSR